MRGGTAHRDGSARGSRTQVVWTSQSLVTEALAGECHAGAENERAARRTGAVGGSAHQAWSNLNPNWKAPHNAWGQPDLEGV